MRVLIVDDDPNLRDSFALELTRAGHAVTVEPDAAGAVGALMNGGADLVLLDLRIGAGRGREVAEAATRFCPAARLVVINGTGELTRDEIFDLAPGVAAVLRKPVDIETLAGTIDGACAGGLDATRAEGRRPRT